MTQIDRRWMRGSALALCAMLGSAAHAAQGPYDEQADAAAQVQAAMAVAAAEQRPLLLVFGANWCPDCRVLELTMKKPAMAARLQSDFARVVKIDVGRYDHNMDLATRYGVPLKKGIPAVAVLSPSGALRYATQAGELADARGMGDDGIRDFFDRLAGPRAPNLK